ncbi:hypothetical protein [uncultured Flavobacterium sp.]|uniref:hypothetical protein n=1 Tax=uncultured Flavobacterium sp. TaxID=165435 RepID=UPI0025E4C528|nr:hypothetical protein [uncultured Flavobacterium sp.]
MEAIRKIVTVKNHQINITLPDDFYADEVEVIILPKQDDDFELTEEMKQILDNRANEPTEDYLTSEESLLRLKKKHGL